MVEGGEEKEEVQKEGVLRRGGDGEVGDNGREERGEGRGVDE